MRRTFLGSFRALEKQHILKHGACLELQSSNVGFQQRFNEESSATILPVGFIKDARARPFHSLVGADRRFPDRLILAISYSPGVDVSFLGVFVCLCFCQFTLKPASLALVKGARIQEDRTHLIRPSEPLTVWGSSWEARGRKASRKFRE